MAVALNKSMWTFRIVMPRILVRFAWMQKEPFLILL